MPPSNTHPTAGMLPSLPNISTTISSILSTSTPTQSTPTAEHDKPANARSNPASPLSLASFLPATPSMMTSWFQRKPTSPKNAANASLPETTSSGDDTRDAQSQTDSTNNDAAATTKKRKRCSRPKTSYTLCHAPPRAGQRHKIKVRARPLLQLHKQESRSRPRPAFELLPSAIFSPRLVKAIAKFSTSKLGMNPTDLAVVRAEDYHRHESSPDTEDETHDILAMICGAAKGAGARARICLEGGIEWDAYQMASGSYECTSVDAHGLKRTVRWVLKRSAKGGPLSPVANSQTPILSPVDSNTEHPDVKRFNFSTISANTRRHPVIANLTIDNLDISDTYTIPVPSASVDAAIPPFERRDTDDTNESNDEAITTTEELRNLITATAIFVAVAEGWCTNYRSEDSLCRSPSTKSSSPVKSASPRHYRTSSIDTDPKRRSNSLLAGLRSNTVSLRRNSSVVEELSSSASSVSDMAPAPIASIPEHNSAARRRRADTTATVIMHGESQWRPAYDDETEDEHQDEEDIKSAKSSPDLDRRSFPGRTLGGEGAKKFSTASTVVGGADMRERGALQEKDVGLGEKVEAKRKPKAKKGLVSRMLCGLV